MANTVMYKDLLLAVGDRLRVTQRFSDNGKSRQQFFDGLLIAIKGQGKNRSITVRKIGEGGIGIEKIFPLSAPTIENIVVKRAGGKGVRHAKIYFVRKQTKKAIEKIYARVTHRK